MKKIKNKFSIMEMKDIVQKNNPSSFEVNEQLKNELLKLIKDESAQVDILPLIDKAKIMLPEFAQIYDWIEEGFNRFKLKGSRGSGKSTWVIQYIILDMLNDSRASWFCIMENKVQHSDTTMNDLKFWIDELDKLWPGFAKKWTKKDGQSIKEWIFSHNGSYQKIKYIGLDECSKGTITPPSGNVWKGFHLEEPITSNEAFGLDREKIIEKFKVLETLRGTATRFFNRLKPSEQKNARFIEFQTFNPYNEENPILEDFTKYHPDNREELRKYGFTSAKNKELNEVYITSNYRVNKENLPPAFLEYMNRVHKQGGEDEKVLADGMTGSPINTLYKNIFHFIDKNKQLGDRAFMYREKGYAQFNRFVICIDVGGGGDGQMTIGLLGEVLGAWIPIEEWGSKKWEQVNNFDSEKIAMELWKQIALWNNHYVNFSKKIIPIVMDNDIHFKTIFQKAFNLFNKINWRAKFQIFLFKEKYKTIWKNENRPRIVRYLISNKMLRPFPQLTPNFVSQLKATKWEKNGKKIMDGNDDFRQMFELGIFHIAKEIGQRSLSTGKLFDKDMINFLKGL